ncbi:hypothetical protein MN116_008712 [Schistosoma mekongi]|uniref:Uncharacterized protein n=1 Tax=Schistosoma mekongi TaxID=38744 RepID=A0AAE2D289_SCHME|nr:hypothetical protein MN116_008712 [Schistosoma mekongi]
MDLDDYVISAVQIPPGCNSRKLLDVSNPHVEKFLRKFMKRLVKKPNTPFSRVLPTLDDRGGPFSLCVTDCQTPYIPYVIRASDLSWHIRQFPTHRLSIRSSKFDNDCIILDENEGRSCSNSLKRSHLNVEYSPQLITSSDEEINSLPKIQRRE